MRSLALAVFLLPAVAYAQLAPQTWPADQDGANFICADVQYFQANNLAGVGTRCVRTDATGKLIPASFDCADESTLPNAQFQDATLGLLPQERLIGTGFTNGSICAVDDPGNGRTNVDICAVTPIDSGSGTKLVTRVISNGVGQLSSASTIGLAGDLTESGGNLTQADYPLVSRSTNAPTNAVNMGALASGVNEQTTAAGVATPLTYQCVQNEIQVGGTNGGLAQSINFTWDGTNFLSGTTSQFIGTGATVSDATAGGSYINSINTSTSTSAFAGYTMGLEATYATKPVGFFGTFPANYVTASLQSSLLFELQHGGTTGALIFSILDAPGGPIRFQTHGRVTRAEVEDAGNFQFVNMAAPSTPPSGTTAAWTDSTSKNWAVKNDAGTVNHGAQTQTNTTGQALTALADDGSWTRQAFQAPLTACTDYVSVSCQGAGSDIGTGGSNSAVQNIALHDGGGNRLPTSGSWVGGAFLGIFSGTIQALTPPNDIVYTLIANEVGQSAYLTTLGGVSTNSFTFIADHTVHTVTMRLNVVSIGLTGGTFTIEAVQNGSAVCSVALTSASSPGVFSCQGNTSSPSSTDSYGIFISALTATGVGPQFTVMEVLN